METREGLGTVAPLRKRSSLIADRDGARVLPSRMSLAQDACPFRPTSQAGGAVMKPTRPVLFSTSLLLAAQLTCFLSAAGPVQAGPKPSTYWRVDDVRRGMKGHGRTVMKGTKVETFQVEVLGT